MDSAESVEHTRDDQRDEVEETFYSDRLDVKVQKVIRAGMEEDQPLLKVYGKRRSVHGTLDGSGTEQVTQYQKLVELETQSATEVLFGLAEAHGYELEGK